MRNPGEKPWVALTLSWFERLQIAYENNDFASYKIKGGSSISSFSYSVPGDWSSALYPIAAAIVTQSEITLHGVDYEDPQGDKKVVALLQKLGVKFSLQGKSLTVHRGSFLEGSSIDANDFIDAITILPVLACRAKAPTHIYGAQIARAKESDRIYAIVSELRKMGARIEETEDGMIVYPSDLVGSSVVCFHDHRMALALSIAGLMAKGDTEIIGASVCRKSFPAYFEKLRKLGASIE